MSIEMRGSGPIRAAVAGLGYWGPNLARNFATNDDYALTALCDVNPKQLASVAARYPAVRAVHTLDDLLATAPEIVAVATPVAGHYEVARRCLEAGAHVLVEKPFTATVEQAEDLLALSERVSRQVFVDHTFVFTPAVEAMKAQLDAGAIGELLYVDSTRINLGLFQPDVDVIWDLAPHDLSILHYLLGRQPNMVSAMGASHNPTGAVDVAYLHLSYGDGLTVHLHLSWLSPVKVRRMIIAGKKQSLIFDDLDQDTKIKLYDHGVAFEVTDVEAQRQMLVSYRKGEMRAPAIAQSEALAVQAREIAMCLRGKAVARSSGRDGLAVVSILSAASRSLAAGGLPLPVKER